MKIQERYNKKLIQQIVLLIVIVVAIIFLLPFGSMTTTPPTGNSPQINTQFNTDALKQVEEKETNYPSVDPSPNELGKQDPFS